MEYFESKYSKNYNPNNYNPNTFIVFICIYSLQGISNLIAEKYFNGVLFLICAATMLIFKYVFTVKSKKEKEPPFFGIIIDPEKNSIYGKGANLGFKEIFFDDVNFIKLNSPYNDTLEINTKDHKVTRIPLYWLAEEEQKRIKEILKQYIC